MPRGRPPLVEPVRALTTHINEALMARVDILLFSPLEGRVPKGAYQRFLTALIRRSFEQEELDLAPYLGALPGEHRVFGSPETLVRLLRHLQQQPK